MTDALPSAAEIGGALPRYRIEAQVGRGGMSVVYLAEDLGPLKRKRVALKVLAPTLAADERFRSRFVRESEIVANLEHPHVIPVYDAGEVGNLLYLVMRFIDGPDLRALLQRDGPFPPARIAPIVTQVAGALDAAHRQGLVHRDVKPANVMVDRAGEADQHSYLCDFGITKQTASAETLTGTGQFIGTLDYIAPEQIEGKPVDARTDVYALGCVLYQCLTGRVPYPMDTDVAKLWAHVRDDAPSVRATRGEVPGAVDDVVGRAMAKNPDDRFESCGALARALDAAVSTPEPSAETVSREHVVAAPGASAETVGRPAPVVTADAVVTEDDRGPTGGAGNRRRLLVGAAVLGALVLIGVAVVVLTRGGDSFPDTAEEAMLAQVPAGYRDTCERAEPPDGATAAVACAPDSGAETMTLISYSSRAATSRAFRAAQRSSPVGDDVSGDCAENVKGAHAFSNGKGEEGMVLCYRRGDAESVLVWTDPGSSLLGRALRTDNKDNEMYRWWAALVDRPESDTFPTSDEQALLDELPSAIPPTCQRADPQESGIAALWCQPEGGPSQTYYTRFADQAALDARYNAIRENAGVAVDEGEANACPSERSYTYARTEAVGGRRICFYEGTVVRITYTENTTLVLVEDINTNGDIDGLWAWYEAGSGTP